MYIILKDQKKKNEEKPFLDPHAKECGVLSKATRHLMKGTKVKYKDCPLESTILAFVCRIYGKRQVREQGDLSVGFASGLIWQWQWGHTLDGCRQIDETHRRKHGWIRLLAQPADADDTILMAESEEDLKSLLMRVNEESENTGLKLNIIKLRSWHPVPLLHGK